MTSLKTVEEMIAFLEVDGVGVALFKNEHGVKLTVSGSKEFIKEVPLTQHNQAIMGALIERLEGELDFEDEQDALSFSRADGFRTAIAIIREVMSK